MILGIIVLMGAACVHLAPRKLRAKFAHAEACENNLRQIGMAALQYSDDKRFLPHIAALGSLDGGYRSNTASRALRSLVHFAYIDDPDVFVCPASPDAASPVQPAAMADPRTFRWSSGDGAPLPSPIVAADVSDRPLNFATEISYGWARRVLTTNARFDTFVAADKSMRPSADASASSIAAHQRNMTGNHADFMIVVNVACWTRRVPRSGDSFTVTELVRANWKTEQSGYLGVLGDDPEQGQ
ncbi:MAG: hypothetical protein ACAI25_16780 [Planctomycetota bacterium]